MIQTLSIQKLTPPQLTALREALPACVAAGVLTTTRSIATFTLPEDYAGPVSLDPAAVVDSLTRVRTKGNAAQLAKIVAKLRDPAAEHLRTA